ncbi:MAG: BatA and WFA domain-containing protein [Bacteroidota bacterium]
MIFTNPIFLWASLAIAIPIIVHLFNFRRPKRIEFSDISLVQEVKKSVVKRMRLRQWLLLAARCLALLALVAVFANPVIRRDDGPVKTGNTSVAIVLDNSYSMEGTNDKGAYWQQAQQLAREVVEAYGRADEFLVMTNDEPRINYNFGEQQASVKELRNLSVRQNTNSLADLLAVSEDIFANASNANRVLYFISDFQKSTILPDSLLSFKRGEGIDINLVPLTTRKLRNAYIADHRIETQIVEKDKPVELQLTLVNDAPEPVNKINLRVVVGNDNRPVATENLDANQESELKVNLIPKSSGWQSGYIEIDDYPIEYDNRRYFSYYVPFREKMLVVEESPAPNLRLMFGGEVLDQFDVKFISFRDLAAENLDEYKSILLFGLTDISTGLQEKLRAHLGEGNSILYFPGANLKSSGINGFFSSLGIGTFGDYIEKETGDFASGADLDHPVFEGVFASDTRSRKFDSPTVYKYYRFRPSNAVIQNVILRMGNQDPILLESRPEGGGLVYTFTTFPGESWTDLTLKSSGLAIMVQLARIMNQTQQVQQNEDLGGAGYKRVKTREQDVVRMLDSEGTEIIPEQFVQSGYIVLKFDQQKLKEGNYALVQQERQLEEISFNVPDAESQLAARSEQELRDFLNEQGIEGLQVTPAVRGGFAQEIRIASEGVPLWKYFLALAALFLFAEFLILRLGTKPATA